MATTAPTPDKDRLGPKANSKLLEVLIPTREEKDGKNNPFSIPPTSKIHSTSPVTSYPSANLVSHCHPY